MTDQKQMDLDGDGAVNEEEIRLYALKQRAQRKIALTAMWSVIICTGILLSPLVQGDKIEALSTILATFYVSMAGITGAFVGVTSWLNRK